MAGKVGCSSLRPYRGPQRIDGMRTLLVVLFDDVQSLDVTGPVEVFASVEIRCPGTYRIVTASLDGAPVRTSSGLTLVPDHSLADAGLLQGRRATSQWLALDHLSRPTTPDPRGRPPRTSSTGSAHEAASS